MPENFPTPPTISEEPKYSESQKKTWRSWFTTGRIVLISVALVVLPLFIYSAKNKIEESARRAEYDAQHERYIADRDEATTQQFNFFGAPEGFESRVDRKIFENLAYSKSIKSETSSSGRQVVSVQLSRDALGDPQQTVEALEKIGAEPNLEEIIIYWPEGPAISIEAEILRKQNLSVEDWQKVLENARLSANSEYFISITADAGVHIYLTDSPRGMSHPKYLAHKKDIQKAYDDAVRLAQNTDLGSVEITGGFIEENSDGTVKTVDIEVLSVEETPRPAELNERSAPNE